MLIGVKANNKIKFIIFKRKLTSIAFDVIWLVHIKQITYYDLVIRTKQRSYALIATDIEYFYFVFS